MKIAPTRYRFLSLYISVLISAIGILFAGCEKGNHFDPEGENKLVILAEITAGDSAYIPISQSVFARQDGSVNFKKINNAAVIITEEGGTEMSLQLNNNAQYTDLPAGVYSGSAHFKPNTTYTIRVSHPDFGIAEAVTHIPPAFAVSDMDPGESSFGSKKAFKFEFEIKDNGSQSNYYTFEALKQRVTHHRYFYWKGQQYDYDTQEGKNLYEQIEDDEDTELPIEEVTATDPEIVRLNILTNDNQTANTNIGSIDSSYDRILLSDSLFNGESYSTSFYVPASEVLPADTHETGQVIIRVKSIGKDFFNYLVAYEKYKAGFGILPLGSLNSPEGNIQNGFGVFGGSYKLEWKFNYEDLD